MSGDTIVAIQTAVIALVCLLVGLLARWRETLELLRLGRGWITPRRRKADPKEEQRRRKVDPDEQQPRVDRGDAPLIFSAIVFIGFTMMSVVLMLLRKDLPPVLHAVLLSCAASTLIYGVLGGVTKARFILGAC